MITQLAAIVLSVVFASAPSVEADWPRFRGAAGRATAEATGLAATFAEDERLWTATLPGSGHSSPVVAGGRVFVTSFDASASSLVLSCLDARDGSETWAAPLELEGYEQHDLNSYASSTPACGEGLVAVTWTSGTWLNAAAFDHEGTLLWNARLGRTKAQHGSSVSPVLVDGTLVVGNDNEGPKSYLVGLDARTGKESWRRERKSSRASFSTPTLHLPEEGPPELIFASTSHGVTCLNPKTGELHWEVDGLFRARCVASPAVGGGVVFVTAGQGGGGKVGVALRLGVTDEPREQYRVSRALPYVPSPVATDERLYLWNDGGIVSCLELQSGSEIWRERAGEHFYGSPVLADGKLYAISTSGVLTVVRAADEFELLGTTDLGEASHATPAIADGVLFARTMTRVIALKAR